MESTIETAFRDLLGSPPQRGEIYIVTDTGMSRGRDCQVSDDRSSFYLVPKAAWLALRPQLEARISADIETFVTVIEFNSTHEYGDLFTRIANAAEKKLYMSAGFRRA